MVYIDTHTHTHTEPLTSTQYTIQKEAKKDVQDVDKLDQKVKEKQKCLLVCSQ